MYVCYVCLFLCMYEYLNFCMYVCYVCNVSIYLCVIYVWMYAILYVST